MKQLLKANYQHWSIQIDADKVVWLIFDRAKSKVNSLHQEALQELSLILEEINRPSELKAVILLSGKKTGFIVGADIQQFKLLSTVEEASQLIRQGQEIFNQLAALSLPTIAMIEGFCLGGGLELALACRYRLAEDSPKTRLGLPEVKLGIHPGWGGTVRLPQLIGAPNAMDLILSGRLVSAKAAKKMGLVDEAVPQRLLLKAAKQYAMAPPARKRGIFGKLMGLSNQAGVRPLLGRIFQRRLSAKIRPEHYPAPFQVIDNWVKYGVGPGALDAEARSISELLVSDTSRNLVRVFFMQEELKAAGKGTDYRPKHVHVVGAGVMGGDIAAWCAFKGMTVTLQDQAPQLIAKAMGRAYELAEKQLKEKHLVKKMMDRLIPDIHGEGIARADCIIEAITEKLEAKQKLFAMLETQAPPEAILATNTSTIPLEEIARGLKDPSRLVGIHFFNPVAKMPLVEVVVGAQTDAQIVKKAQVLVGKIDKLPLKVKSAPGFLVNRILLPYMLEAMHLFEEGVRLEEIDRAAEAFGMPMGPIELADAVGLDICLAALEKLKGPEKIPVLLKNKVANGELGRKTNKGFYVYAKKTGKAIKAPPPKGVNEAEQSRLIERLVAPLLSESQVCLAEGIVENADLLDAGCIFGFGFAPFRGGPMATLRRQSLPLELKKMKEGSAL